MGLGSEWTFFQRRNTDGQQAREKIFNITDYQGNVNQNHSKVLPHTSQIHYDKKKKDKK